MPQRFFSKTRSVWLATLAATFTPMPAIIFRSNRSNW